MFKRESSEWEEADQQLKTAVILSEAKDLFPGLLSKR